MVSVCVVWCESSRVYTVYTLNGVFVRIQKRRVEQNHVPHTVTSMKYTRCLIDIVKIKLRNGAATLKSRCIFVNDA